MEFDKCFEVGFFLDFKKINFISSENKYYDNIK
jgi:hypothetical protein